MNDLIINIKSITNIDVLVFACIVLLKTFIYLLQALLKNYYIIVCI